MPANSTAAQAASSFYFSTDALPERDRVAVWREQFGRKIARYDFEPLGNPFHGHVAVHAVSGLGLATVDHSPMRIMRTRELLTDGDDDLILQISKTGSVASQLGREITNAPGDAMLNSNSDVGTFVSPSADSRCVLLALSRRRLRPLLGDFDRALMLRVPAATPALKLLKAYIGGFSGEPALSIDLEETVIGHIYELVALAIGSKRQTIDSTNGLGVRAARLHAAKKLALRHLGSQSLSPVMIAAHLGVTARYVHMLFEDEDASFGAFVLSKRLERAYRMLRDPRFNGLSISAISFDVGFGDLSHFNRSFRRRFGCTPSDVRKAAREPEPPAT